MGRTRKFGAAIFVAGLLTIIAGALLYWRRSGGFQASWITTGTGLVFTAAALVAIGTFIFGALKIKPTVEKLESVGSAVEQGGGPPTAEQMGEIQRLSGALRRYGTIDVILLGIALFGMATARYFPGGPGI